MKSFANRLNAIEPLVLRVFFMAIFAFEVFRFVADRFAAAK